MLADALVQVKGEVQGPENALASFLKEIDNGPRFAHVVKLEKEEKPLEQSESGFLVQDE